MVAAAVAAALVVAVAAAVVVVCGGGAGDVFVCLFCLFVLLGRGGNGAGMLGSDQRFKRKTVYPGAPEMYLGLSLGPVAEAPKSPPQGVIWCVPSRGSSTYPGRVNERVSG